MSNLPKGISLRPFIIINESEINDINEFKTSYEYVQDVNMSDADFLQNIVRNLGLNPNTIFEKNNHQINGIKLKTSIDNIERFHDFYTGKFNFEELLENLSFKNKKFSIPQTTSLEFFIKKIENDYLLYLCSSIEKLNKTSVKTDIISNRTLKLRIVDFFASIFGQSKCQIYSFHLSENTLKKIKDNLDISGDIIERGNTFGCDVKVGEKYYFIYFSSDGGIYSPSRIDKDRMLNFHKENVKKFIIGDRYRLYPQIRRKPKDKDEDETNIEEEKEKKKLDDRLKPFHEE